MEQEKDNKIEGKEKFMILLYFAYDNDVTFIVLGEGRTQWVIALKWLIRNWWLPQEDYRSFVSDTLEQEYSAKNKIGCGKLSQKLFQSFFERIKHSSCVLAPQISLIFCMRKKCEPQLVFQCLGKFSCSRKKKLFWFIYWRQFISLVLRQISDQKNSKPQRRWWKEKLIARHENKKCNNKSLEWML